MLLVLHQHVDDLRKVEGDRALLKPDVAPSLVAQGITQLGQLGGAHPAAQDLTANESDADLLWLLRGHQCSSRAGCTISVSTPPVAEGWTKATRELRMPVRGRSSISRIPAADNSRSTCSMSCTR